MIVGIYVTGVVLFATAFALTSLLASVRKATATAHRALQAITDRDLDEDDKERIAQEAGLSLLNHCGLITLKGAITVAAAALPFWLADLLALVPWGDSIAFAIRLDVLGITTIVMVVAAFIWRHWLTSNT